MRLFLTPKYISLQTGVTARTFQIYFKFLTELQPCLVSVDTERSPGVVRRPLAGLVDGDAVGGLGHHRHRAQGGRRSEISQSVLLVLCRETSLPQVSVGSFLCCHEIESDEDGEGDHSYGQEADVGGDPGGG